MTARSRAQVDKDIARRQAGIKVKPAGGGAQGPAQKLTPRSTAQVDKDAHRRALGQKVAPRGRLSDAATGRLDGLRARAVPDGKFNPSQHPRDTRGKFR
jgi:hypothetical protein